MGTASFICLDKIEHLKKAMATLKTPEDVPRLFDLVRPARKEYATAFYHAIKDTLVANDLDQVIFLY